MFNNDGKKDAALHLIRFQMHIRKLKVDFPEDCLMKIFLATLEGEAQSWYENFPLAYIYCLKDFHTIFLERYKESCPSLMLVQNCCEHVDSFIKDLENFYGDNELMDGEIMEALYKSSFQQHTEILEDTYQDQQVEDFHMAESFVSDLPIEEDSMQESQVSISECDNVQSACSDLHSSCEDQEYRVLNSVVENI